MGSGRYKSQKRTIPIAWIAFGLSLLVICFLLYLLFCGQQLPEGEASEPLEAETGATESVPVEKNENIISIPGYEGLTLVANTTKQDLCFPNPAKNTCYFKLTLSLDDGTVLWQSGLIEPGGLSENVKLTQPLQEGTYRNAVLRYDCFAMDDDLTVLNGATTKLQLWVK